MILDPTNAGQMAAAMAMQAQQGPAVTVAAPFNDMQLCALLAATCDKGTATDSVEYAINILAEVYVQLQSGALNRAVKERQQE